MDSLARRAFDVDIGSQLPHAALRVFVMGERGANREPATEADIHAMAAIERNECVVVEQQIELIALVSPPAVQQIDSERATGRRPLVERVHGSEVTCGC